MQARSPHHRAHGLGKESITVNMPTLLLERMVAHLREIGSTRAAYITSVVQADLDRLALRGITRDGSADFGTTEP